MDFELYKRQLETLVNIDSGSANAEGVNRVADKLAGWYTELGWQVQEIMVGEGSRKVLLITNHPAEHYDVMFIGHMDTVFPDGTAAKRPFHIEGDNCYGPGVGDMKNGDVAMYHVAANLSPEVSEKLNIAMVYNPDEEIGSVYSREVTDRIAAQSSIVVVMESAGQLGTRHCFVRKGSLGYTLEFHGQAAHAGFMFEVENASAVLEMGHAIVELMNLASREKNTTVNVGVAQGGTAANVVADYAKITVNARFFLDEERDRIKNAVHQLVEGEPYVKGVKTVIVSESEGRPLVESEKTKAFVGRLKELAAELDIPFLEKPRGGLSDANHLAYCGSDPIVLDGMGPHGANDHSEKEYSYLKSAVPCVQLLLRMLEDMAGF